MPHAPLITPLPACTGQIAPMAHEADHLPGSGDGRAGVTPHGGVKGAEGQPEAATSPSGARPEGGRVAACEDSVLVWITTRVWISLFVCGSACACGSVRVRLHRLARNGSHVRSHGPARAQAVVRMFNSTHDLSRRKSAAHGEHDTGVCVGVRSDGLPLLVSRRRAPARQPTPARRFRIVICTRERCVGVGAYQKPIARRFTYAIGQRVGRNP